MENIERNNRRMDYFEWAEEYYENARRVLSVIEKKKLLLKESKKLTADRRKELNDDIIRYRRIYYELNRSGDTLRSRAEGAVREA